MDYYQNDSNYDFLKNELNLLMQNFNKYQPVNIESTEYKLIKAQINFRDNLGNFNAYLFIGLILGGIFNLSLYYCLGHSLFSLKNFFIIVLIFICSLASFVFFVKRVDKNSKKIGLLKEIEISNEIDELSVDQYKIIKELCSKSSISKSKINEVIKNRNGVFLKIDYDQLSVYRTLTIIDKINDLDKIRKEKSVIVQEIKDNLL